MQRGISRRQFVGSAGVLAAGASIAASSAAAQDKVSLSAEQDGPRYAAGKYTATARGRRGDVTVEVEFSDDAITSVTITDEQETRPIAETALAHVPAAIVDGQTLNVETVSGSTFTSNAILDAVADCVQQAGGDADALRDTDPASESAHLIPGTYEETVHGHHSDVVVRVTLSESSIDAVEIVDEGETYNLADAALDTLPQAVIDAQTSGVDTVAGATYTSRAILTAIERAITEAGGEEAYRAFSHRVITPRSDEEKTVDVDVVVVGSGMAGIAAALRAQDEGASVALVEKLPFIGGVSQTSEGWFREPAEDTDAGRESYVNYLEKMYVGSMKGDTQDAQYPDSAWATRLADTITEAVDWLKGKGADLAYTDPSPVLPALPDYKTVGVYFSQDGLAEPDLVGTYFVKFVDAFAAAGGQVFTDCPVTELVTDGDGAVIGCRANGRDGNYTFNAKAVILTAGGFGANPTMVAQLAPAYSGEENATLVGNVGDGIQMGMGVGASVYDDAVMMGQKGHGIVTDYEMTHPYEDSLNPRTSIFVNSQGLRVNSETPANYTGGSSYVNPDGRDYYWCVINAEQASDSLDVRAGTPVDSNKQFIDTLEEQVAAGNPQYIKANAIDELAKKMLVTPNTLRYTLNRYNRFCDEGDDEDFYKKQDYLKKMPQDSGPWYAVKSYMTYFGTVGGLRTDADAEVLDQEGNPIKGLFAGGETANHGVFNLCYLGAISLSQCLVSGYLAGQNAAALAKE